MLSAVLHSFFGASLISLEYVCALSAITDDFSGLCRSNRRSMHAFAVLLSFFRASLISGVYFAYSKARKLFESVWLGSQAFKDASAFNANIGAWNVLRVTTYASAFDDAGLADCIKRGMYDNWGATLHAAYPTWSSLCAVTSATFDMAATAWAINPTTAAMTYGPIADWNTALVTSMTMVCRFAWIYAVISAS